MRNNIAATNFERKKNFPARERDTTPESDNSWIPDFSRPKYVRVVRSRRELRVASLPEPANHCQLIVRVVLDYYHLLTEKEFIFLCTLMVARWPSDDDIAILKDISRKVVRLLEGGS